MEDWDAAAAAMFGDLAADHGDDGWPRLMVMRWDDATGLDDEAAEAQVVATGADLFLTEIDVADDDVGDLAGGGWGVGEGVIALFACRALSGECRGAGESGEGDEGGFEH